MKNPQAFRRLPISKSLDLYMREMAKHDLLTKEQEVEGRMMEEGRNMIAEAVTACSGNVPEMLRQYQLGRC